MPTWDANKNRDVRLTPRPLDFPREPLTELLVNLGEIPTLLRGWVKADRRPPLGKSGEFYGHGECADSEMF